MRMANSATLPDVRIVEERAMSRNAAALQIDFDAPENVSEVYPDPPPADGDGEFDDLPDVVDMIEQEYCFLREDRRHLYLNDALSCCACGMAHPSIRNACGQR
jgi:hypothetical protein